MQVILVHKCTDLSLYERAAREGFILCYNPTDKGTRGDMSEAEFSRLPTYHVPSHQALKLRELILEGASPDHIIRDLALYARGSDVVRHENRVQAPPPSFSARRPDYVPYLDDHVHLYESGEELRFQGHLANVMRGHAMQRAASSGASLQNSDTPHAAPLQIERCGNGRFRLK